MLKPTIDDEILDIMNTVSYDFDPYSYKDNLNRTLGPSEDAKTVGFEQLKAEAESDPKGVLEGFISEYGSDEAKEIFEDTDDFEGLDKIQKVKSYYDEHFAEKSPMKFSGDVAKFMDEANETSAECEDSMTF